MRVFAVCFLRRDVVSFCRVHFFFEVPKIPGDRFTGNLEKYPDARPRIISDNGPQFIAKDFKEFIRFFGLTHVRTSPYYPQSNGKLERWHGVLKQECIRPSGPDTLEQAMKNVTDFVNHYNTVRLHGAIGYITPEDCLNGLSKVIADERDRKLEEARERRQRARQAALVA